MTINTEKSHHYQKPKNKFSDVPVKDLSGTIPQSNNTFNYINTTMEQSTYTREAASKPNHVRDFLNSLRQVYSGLFSMTVTAVFGLPAFIFFAWLLGIVGKILWVSIQWAFNVVW